MGKKDLIKLDDEKSVMRFIQKPSAKIAEALTGILSSDAKDWKLSAGKIVQSVIQGNLLTQLGREIKKYREEGKIKEDYFSTHKNRASLYELLKFLDEEVPDEELFVAIKSIFLSSISKKATKDDEMLAYEFLKTAKKLSGTEVLILKANFEIARDKESIPDRASVMGIRVRSAWRKVIARQMGYRDLDSIVLKYERNLESLGLIAPRGELDRLQSSFELTLKFRLTETGYKFCEFMTNYQ